MGISPSPHGGSCIPPGGIRGVWYMYPRPGALFEGGMRYPPALIKDPPAFPHAAPGPHGAAAQ